jgi:periplasmic protein TonB
MDDAVSDALLARADGSEGLRKMLLVSAAAHVLLMALAALAPASLWQRPIETRSSVVTIDLGPAAVGADTGGLTSMAARPVQRAVQDTPKVQPAHPPAAKTPDLTLPAEKPRVTTTPAPSVTDAPNDARGRTPTDGREAVAGNAPAGGQSPGVGLSMRENGGTGAQLNVGDFCCPEYVGTMVQRIRQHWSSGRGANAVAIVTFTIQRDGTITDARLVRSSGNQMLDFLAQRALLAVRQLPPLPDAYTNPTLVVTLDFQYQR